ncbi:MAG TPA: phosphoribosyltransferase [Sphingomicrobium sp.]|nr:phosphoribosyltransferase [Sphingomicrobium sp.]
MIGQFADRRQAGRALAAELKDLDLKAPVVLALPRGGVPVGYEVAKTLQAPLDVLIVRKIGAPFQQELGIGALVDGNPPQLVMDSTLAQMVGAGTDYVEQQEALQKTEIERRRQLYKSAPHLPLGGRTVILVDDGIATGGTARAALQAIRLGGAGSIILAIPVAPRDALTELAPLCDRIVCLATPDPFYAVGTHYRDFSQTEDEEVVQLLAAAQSTKMAP